jgi:uncharacterized protein (TIGR02679 family)
MTEALRERLSRPGLAPLWDELVRRWESNDRPVATVTLRDLTDAERRAVADLLGSDRLPAARCQVPIARVATSLGVTVDALKSALRKMRGPWRNRAAEREARDRERGDLWTWLAMEASRLGVMGWGERLRARGVVGGDAAVFRKRLDRAVAVLDRLPAPDVPLAGFACDVLGDPHALDHGTWLAAAVLDAIAERGGVPVAASAEDARRLWSAEGVSPDGLSSSVLCLALAPEGDDPVAQFLCACAMASEPVAVTMAQLQRWPVRVSAPVVYAFENPSILAEAARGGWRGPPLVCTSGWPNVAAITLLRQLAGAGARVRYHGDFDSKGLSIAQMLVDRLGVEPWCMGAVDYDREVVRARVPIVDLVPAVSWDDGLATAMHAHRLVVFEEDVRETLLERLRAE